MKAWQVHLNRLRLNRLFRTISPSSVLSRAVLWNIRIEMRKEIFRTVIGPGIRKEIFEKL